MSSPLSWTVGEEPHTYTEKTPKVVPGRRTREQNTVYGSFPSSAPVGEFPIPKRLARLRTFSGHSVTPPSQGWFMVRSRFPPPRVFTTTRPLRSLSSIGNRPGAPITPQDRRFPRAPWGRLRPSVSCATWDSDLKDSRSVSTPTPSTRDPFSGDFLVLPPG